MDARENRLLSEWLTAHAPPSSTVYLWGFEPSVYAASGRHAATRYIYNVPQRVAWSQASYRRMLLANLAVSPPSVIAVERFDVFEKVTGNTLDSAAVLPGFPELHALVEEQYREVFATNRFVLYARREAAAPTLDPR